MRTAVRAGVAIFFTAGICVLASRAGAQTAAPNSDTERARVQIGSLGLTPSVALTNLGSDSNVFNEFSDPKRDFTFTVSPQLGALVNVRRARLQITARSDLVYYRRYSSERSADTAIDSKFEFRGARITPWVSASRSSGRQRFGYEIDLRFRRVSRDVGAGVEGRLTGLTRVLVSAHHGTYEHDADAAFLGSSLRELLNRQSDSIGVELRHSLTPLTTWVTSTQSIRDRFEFTPSRNTNSVRIETGFDLTPFALISGRGRIGYRTLNGDGTTPNFSGLVASVAAGTTLKGRTHLDVTTDRDVSYSLEVAYPYYLQTGVTFVVTPRLTERWDMQGRVGVQRLAYRIAQGFPELLPRRIDLYRATGLGVGFHMDRDMRVGLNVTRERRESPIYGREYLGYRTGLSVTYGR